MAKELPYFKFEISEWMLGRIQKQPLSIQGTFINLCCKYWHKLGELTTVDARLDFDDGPINTLLEKGIIGTDGEYIYIKFLDLQLDECQETSNKNRIAGLKSAKVRAERKQALTTVERPLESVQRNSTEEKRKEDKRREENIYELAKNSFDEMEVERLKMGRAYPGIDIDAQLLQFLEKVRGAPGDYSTHDTAGFRKAFAYQLRNAKQSGPPKKSTEQFLNEALK